MAKKKTSKKNNFIYKNGKLQLSQLIGIILVIGLVLTFAAQFYYDHHGQLPWKEAQVDSSVTDQRAFIKKIAPYAQQMQRQYHVLPSITMAQAILESDWGNSTLSQKFNNFYGIKGASDQPGAVLKTQEFTNGQWETVTARFRSYGSWQESMQAHSLLLVNGTDWNANQYQSVIQAGNYKQAAQALYQDGYATDPGYPEKLINLIQKYNLNQYDQ